MTALLAAAWLLLDYPWGLLAFVAIAGLRRVTARHHSIEPGRKWHGSLRRGRPTIRGLVST
jgi:hypothetical protein